MKVYPYFPPPTETKASLLTTLTTKRRSWLDNLYYRSYDRHGRFLIHTPIKGTR